MEVDVCLLTLRVLRAITIVDCVVGGNIIDVRVHVGEKNELIGILCTYRFILNLFNFNF